MQTINMPPYAPTLIESTRAIGYSLEAAMADIIDNSIAARASAVEVSFFPVGDAYVSILDNGTGMDEEQINKAMQYGSQSPTETRDPLRGTPIQRRGLVLGDVQSGKTANYTAISNKAADAGYRIIIVLAGMMENLRQQTQSRLDAEFAGRRSEYYLDPTAELEIKNTIVGVGRYGTQKRIAAFTSVTRDFYKNVLQSNDLNLQSVQDPIVLVVKKNQRILTNLVAWLRKSRDPAIPIYLTCTSAFLFVHFVVKDLLNS